MQEEKTSLPKREEEVLAFWEENKIFEQSLEKTKEGKPFSFYDGPPFATGLPHYGHILASTIKDLIPRFETMRGRFVRRRWGWDCHGLPIEEIVERKLGISGKKQIEEIGIGKFNEACRETVLTYVEEWGKMVRRMGRWVEFKNAYKTMDRDYMESVWWAFKELWKKDLIYEGRKVLLYCPRCETPLSNFEVAMDNSYKDITEEAVYVKFKILNQEKINCSNAYFLAWTTTPWTLPGNVALAVGTDISYSLVRVEDERYILASDLVQKVLGERKVTIEKELKGSELIGLEYEPLFEVPAMQSEKSYKVYAADFVTTTEGTGIVHTAVVYGEDDYRLGIAQGLPIVPLLDEKGMFNEKAPELVRGEYSKKAEKIIKDDLEERGLLLNKELYTHSYPHCWRCGTALFYNAIPAWFVNIQKIKKDLLVSNDKEINWYPNHLKHGRYEKSVEAAPDWNISRNRYWGNPVPVWKCEGCEEVRVAGSIKDLELEPTTFYFLRHGEAEQNVLGILSSFPEKIEHHLTEKGRTQAHEAAEELHKEGIDIIFSSDLLRTRETAEIIGKISGKEIIFDPRLREIDFGAFSGKPKEEYSLECAKEGCWQEAPGGGETWESVQKRMANFLREATAKYPGKKIVVVSHGDPIWLGLKELGFEIPTEDDPDFAHPYKQESILHDLHRPYIDEVVLTCKKCEGKMRRVPEIFDSWIEAGSMPFAEYHFPFENETVFKNRYPAQFVAEYIAQTRAWFYVMHVLGVTLFGKTPFEHVVTTGTILAEDGSKMSKSKGNFPDPWLVIEKYGVDSLRFYLMRSVVMQADNLNFSVKDLETVSRKVCMILWNVYQYFVTYAAQNNGEQRGERKEFENVLDQWIKVRTKELVIAVTEGLEGYDTVKATRAIEEYIDDLSTWYLRRSRGRKDEDFFGTLREVLITTSKVIAPIMPFLAEILYQGVRSKQYQTESVHLAEWPKVEPLTEEEKKLLEDMAAVREATSVGQAIRKEANIALRQPLRRMAVEFKEKREIDTKLWDVLLTELNVKSADTSLFNVNGEFLKVAQGSSFVVRVALDTAIDESLKQEGIVRALERCVQELRKSEGLKVGEIAELTYETSSELLMNAFRLLNKEKTYIGEIKTGKGEALFETPHGNAKISIKRK